MSLSEIVDAESPEGAPDGPPPWWARPWVWAIALVVVGGLAAVLLLGTAANAAGGCGGG